MLARCLSLATLVAFVAAAQAAPAPKRLFFNHGSSSAYAADKLVGESAKDYILAVNAGQKITVTIASDDPAVRFNVIAAAGQAVLFDGRSEKQPAWSGTLDNEGEYIISVYAARAEPKPEQRARYRLTVTLS
jgi:hypothetical protein